MCIEVSNTVLDMLHVDSNDQVVTRSKTENSTLEGKFREFIHMVPKKGDELTRPEDKNLSHIQLFKWDTMFILL